MEDLHGAVAWLSGLVNVERMPNRRRARFSLAPIHALLSRLGNPERGLRVLHLAGSKGKGSTALLAEALLGKLGWRSGVFTSPHLLYWNERFRIGGAAVSDAALAQALGKLRPHVEALRGTAQAPSFFDAATAAALLLFAEARVDAAILEVGLGGRLDSTNAVQPRVTAISSIELEHTETLGDTLAAIAGEKAGIAKPGAPLLLGPLPPEARRAAAARAAEVGAPLVVWGRDFHAQLLQEGAFHSRFHYTDSAPGAPGAARAAAETGAAMDAESGRGARDAAPGAAFEAEFELAVAGRKQVQNAALALACVRRFADFADDALRSAARAAFAEVRLPGRIELLRRAPLVLADSAHTEASARALAETLARIPRRRAHLVLAVSTGKDLQRICEILAPHADCATATRAEPRRGLPPETIAAALRRAAPAAAIRIAPDPEAALRRARAALHPDDLLYATGSIYLAGLARKILRTEA